MGSASSQPAMRRLEAVMLSCAELFEAMAAAVVYFRNSEFSCSKLGRSGGGVIALLFFVYLFHYIQLPAQNRKTAENHHFDLIF